MSQITTIKFMVPPEVYLYVEVLTTEGLKRVGKIRVSDISKDGREISFSDQKNDIRIYNHLTVCKALTEDEYNGRMGLGFLTLRDVDKWDTEHTIT